MLQLANRSGFLATAFLAADPDGVESLFTLVKATFTIANEMVPSPEQVPIAMKDEYYGDPAATSVRLASDMALIKPATDVMLVGKAYAQGGRPCTQMDVTMSVGPVWKIVRVFGDRVWESGPTGAAPSEPQSFGEMPLIWERSYGGRDVIEEEHFSEARNPVGAAYFAPRSQKTVVGSPLPNLEDPEALIKSPKDNPSPVCFAPVASHWEPRKSFAGTYDENWHKSRKPYLPQDFDSRFFQQAPIGLSTPSYLKGGELVDVRGVTPSGVLRFTLPSIPVKVTYIVDKSREERPTNLDTVLIEPDATRVILTWRSVLKCDKKSLRVKEIEIAAGPESSGMKK